MTTFIISLASLAAIFYCAYLTVSMAKVKDHQSLSAAFLWLIIVVYFFVTIGNLLEHGFGNDALDPYEEYLEITHPLLYLLFVLSFILQEGADIINGQKLKLSRWNEDLEREVEAKSSDLERTYRYLADTRIALIQQERTTSLASMIRKIAHLLNTPLGNSITSASYIIDKYGRVPDEEDPEIFELLMRNLRQMSDLVGNIRDLDTYIQDHEDLPFDAIEVISETLDLIKAEHWPTFDYAVRTQGDTHIIGSRESLRRIVWELADNSVVHNTESQSLTFEVNAVRGEGEVVFRFHDDGKGIPPNIADKVFDPLFTPHMSDKRFGLGLYIAKSIALHIFGGRISLYQSPSGGAGVEVVLPIDRSPLIHRNGYSSPLDVRGDHVKLRAPGLGSMVYSPDRWWMSVEDGNG